MITPFRTDGVKAKILANYDTLSGDGAYHQQDDDQHDAKDRAGSFAGNYIFEVDMVSCKMSTSQFDPYFKFTIYSQYLCKTRSNILFLVRHRLL